MISQITFKRSIPMTGSCDVLVIGGGLGGIGAACAAARAGARTVLVERAAQLGGNATIGGVANWCCCGPLTGQGGVFADILAGQRRLGSLGREHGWPFSVDPHLGRENHQFDGQVLPLVLQHLCERDGVQLRLVTDLVGVEREGRRVTAAVLHDMSGLSAIACRSLIDASGNGLAAQHVGCAVLDPEDAMHPEPLAPSLMVFLRRGAQARPQELLEPAHSEDPRLCPRYSVWPEPDGRIGLKTKWEEWRFDCGTGEGLSRAEATSRRLIPAVVRDFQQRHHADAKLDVVSPAIGVREGRRIRGEHVLTVDEVRAGARFADAVAFGTFTIDSATVNERVPPYQIPFRSLIAAGMDNLLLAGRCISADRLAMASARVMATCCLEGSAAGLAAAQTLAAGSEPSAADPSRVREALIGGSPDVEQALMRDRLG